jgi:hypothetical protein
LPTDESSASNASRFHAGSNGISEANSIVLKK